MCKLPAMHGERPPIRVYPRRHGRPGFDMQRCGRPGVAWPVARRWSILGAGLIFAATLAHAGGIPRPLARIEAERSRWRTGRVEWVQLVHPLLSEPRFYQAAFAGPDTLVIDRGDAEGVVARLPDGTPQENGFGPFYSLQIDDALWLYNEGEIRANLIRSAPRAGILDYRTLGLSYRRHTGDLKTTLHLQQAGSRGVSYRTLRKAGSVIVTADTADGQVVWEIDPRQGGLPVRVTLERAGEILEEARCELVRFGEIWYPGRVAYYRQSWKSGREPYEVIEVLDIEINSPDMPQRFSPAWIHIDAGVNVYVREAGSDEPPKLFKWDGTRLRTLEDFNRAVRAGEIQPGPRFLENARRAIVLEQLRESARAFGQETSPPSPRRGAAAQTQPAGPLERAMTEWELYTARFIEQYRLDAEQSQKALSILKDCQQRARRALARQRATATSPADPSDSADRLLEAIFTKQLKPRLERLPTRAQRRRFGPPGQAGKAKKPARP